MPTQVATALYRHHTPAGVCSVHFSQRVRSFNFRAIESVYKEHCEKKERAEDLARNGADDPAWTDSAVWEKVCALVINPHLIVKEERRTQLCFFPSQDGGAGFPGNSVRGKWSQKAGGCGEEEK